MRGMILAAALAALLGMAGLFVYGASRLEAEYRQLIQDGEAAAAADQTFVAIEAFSGAITLKPDSMLAHLRRGEAYRRRGELTAAFRDLQKACNLDPSAPQPLEQLGDVYFDRGRYAEAAAQYQRYIDLDDRSPRVLYKLAAAQRNTLGPSDAIKTLRRALALDGGFAEAHYLLGVCLVETGDSAEAIRELQRALTRASMLVVAREALAELYRGLDRPNDEMEQLAELVRGEPDRAERRIALGLAQARAGRTDLAVTTLGDTVGRFPEHPRVFAALGRVWLDEYALHGDRVALRKAVEALANAAVRPDASSESLALFGRALLSSGDRSGAERVLTQATERFPVDPVAFTALASAAVRSGHPLVARDALLKYASLRGSRTDLRVLVQLGDLSLRSGDPASAVAWYERALGAAPGDILIQERLADARRLRGRNAS